MSRPSGPICVQCQVPFRPFKNGVTVELLAAYGSYELWEADEWACPVCDARIITGFAQSPFAHHYDTDYSVQRQREVDAGRIRASVK